MIPIVGIWNKIFSTRFDVVPARNSDINSTQERFIRIYWKNFADRIFGNHYVTKLWNNMNYIMRSTITNRAKHQIFGCLPEPSLRDQGFCNHNWKHNHAHLSCIPADSHLCMMVSMNKVAIVASDGNSSHQKHFHEDQVPSFSFPTSKMGRL